MFRWCKVFVIHQLFNSDGNSKRCFAIGQCVNDGEERVDNHITGTTDNDDFVEEEKLLCQVYICISP